MNPNTLPPHKLPQVGNAAKVRLLKILAEREAKTQLTATSAPALVPSKSLELPTGMQPDPYQDRAVELAVSGQSFVLTGPAGSGKSTTVKRVVKALIESESAGVLANTGHKHLRDGAPGIVLTGFTNRAVDNDRAMLPPEFGHNCLTIHKLLEYEPEYYLNDEGKRCMRFIPKRDMYNPLPQSITTIIIEEATLTNVPLWNLLWNALRHRVQIIFIGDIQQLPPVFGKPIFIHAMQKGLPIVELKNIYRTADGSPILELAHRILSGKPIPAPMLEEWNITRESGKLQVRTWPKPKRGNLLSETQAIILMQDWLPKQITSGKYDPERDMLLIPFNKAFGTIELNKIIASHLAKAKEAEVWEIFTGITKKYFRVGERVIFNKKNAWILSIEKNRSYYGKTPRRPSSTMDYAGIEHNTSKLLGSAGISDEELQEELDTMDVLFSSLADHTKEGDSVSRAASHILTIEVEDEGEYRISTVGEITGLDLGYCQTVHRAQGSEADRVMFILHNSHDVMAFRELLYTAVTRAKKELVILCEPNSFVKGISNQRLPGKSLEEKLAKFEDWIAKHARLGTGNVDEIPTGLEDLITRNTKLIEGVQA